MVNKKVLISGSKGTIGNVIIPTLRNCEIYTIDLPERDLTKLKSLPIKPDIFIHLAWNPKSFKGNEVHPDNFFMLHNLFRLSVKYKIPKLILASSVHTDNFYNHKTKKLISVPNTPTPNGHYGAFKLYMESLGKYYSSLGFEVICPRIGGVNRQNTPDKNEKMYKQIFLDHTDLIAAFQKMIDRKTKKGGFEVFYLVSNNPNKIHNTANSLDWKPK